jgi:hypothetical protein
MNGFVFMGSVGIMLLCALISAKYRGSIRRNLERLTGVKMVREGEYEGGLDDETYEGIILETPIIIVLLAAVMYYPFAHNFPFYIGFMMNFTYPFLILLLRIRTFNDSSILEETGIGYHPAYCFLLSIAAGGFTTATGFSMLNFPDKGPFELACIVIVLGLIAQSIPLFPDYINKIVPFEIRSRYGYKFMAILAAVLFFVTWIIKIYIQSNIFGL